MTNKGAKKKTSVSESEGTPIWRMKFADGYTIEACTFSKDEAEDFGRRAWRLNVAGVGPGESLEPPKMKTEVVGRFK